MTRITGSEISGGLRKGTTYGTAVAIGVGHKGIYESFTDSVSTTIGESVGIGSGEAMASSADVLKKEVTVSLGQQGRYNDGNLPFLLACFLGSSPAPTEITPGEEDYLHLITFLNTANNFFTASRTITTTESLEYPSCYVTDLNISISEVPGYLTYTANLIANDRVIDSAVNTVATLNASTVLGNSIISAGISDYFYFNAQGAGALSSGDKICVQSIDINLSLPRVVSNGIGCSKVIKDDKLQVSITLNFDTTEDLTHFTNYHSGTEHKALLKIEGEAINAGENESITFYFPRLKAVESPTSDASDAGVNGQSVTYKALVASANPTGMDDTYPYVEIVNGNSASILA